MPTETLAATATSRALHEGLLLKERYRIVKELGSGGFATVYLAQDEQLVSKPVVVKVLHRLTADAWLLRKFQQEKEALVRIDHPGVVAVLDAGETPQNAPFLVMQFVDGVTLRRMIHEGGMEFGRAAAIIGQIGSALQAAHDKGICHRDLKPENIMVQSGEPEDHVKLIDFGIAGITNSLFAEGSQQTPYDLALAMKEYPVSLYTSPMCKEACQKARDYRSRVPRKRATRPLSRASR